MTAGLSDDFQQIDAAHKTAIINAKFHWLDIADNRPLTDTLHILLAGKSLGKQMWAWSRFCCQELSTINDWTPAWGSERILTLQLSTSLGPVNIVTAYASTLYSNPDIKDQFYNALDRTIGMLTPSEHIYLLVDFNARVGAEHSTWSTCIDHHVLKK